MSRVESDLISNSTIPSSLVGSAKNAKLLAIPSTNSLNSSVRATKSVSHLISTMLALTPVPPVPSANTATATNP